MKLISIKSVYYLSLLCLGVSYSSAGYTEPKAVELYAVNYPPYMIVDPLGNISGIDVEVTKSAFKAVDVPVRIVTAPWKRVLKSLKFGYIAGSLTCSQRSDRESYLNYSDKISEANQVAVLKRETDDSLLINFHDLKHFKVIAVEGWGIQKELVNKKIKHNVTQELDNGIRSVIYRDIDIFYSGELAALYRAKQLNLEHQIKTKRFADKKSDSFHLCFSKAFEGNINLMNKFNQGLKLIKASGEFDDIYRKYL